MNTFYKCTRRDGRTPRLYKIFILIHLYGLLSLPYATYELYFHFFFSSFIRNYSLYFISFIPKVYPENFNLMYCISSSKEYTTACRHIIYIFTASYKRRRIEDLNFNAIIEPKITVQQIKLGIYRENFICTLFGSIVIDF